MDIGRRWYAGGAGALCQRVSHAPSASISGHGLLCRASPASHRFDAAGSGGPVGALAAVAGAGQPGAPAGADRRLSGDCGEHEWPVAGPSASALPEPHDCDCRRAAAFDGHSAALPARGATGAGDDRAPAQRSARADQRASIGGRPAAGHCGRPAPATLATHAATVLDDCAFVADDGRRHIAGRRHRAFELADYISRGRRLAQFAAGPGAAGSSSARVFSRRQPAAIGLRSQCGRLQGG